MLELPLNEVFMAKNGKNAKNSTAPRQAQSNSKAWQQVVMGVVGVIIIFTMLITLFMQ